MSITNFPPMLNETGEGIVNALSRRNSLISMIIQESDRNSVYNDILQVRAIVQNGYGARAFPVGDQIIIPWKDMDDPNHNTDATAYQVPLDIVHHGQVELMSGETVPGMYVQWHFATPYGVQFSHPEAFKRGPLPAGTYSVTFSDTWGSAVGGAVYHFTLTQPVPEDGVLSGFEGMPYTAPANWKVKNWANPTDANPTETVNVSIGSGGTSLGVMPYAIDDDVTFLNPMQRVAYGSNNWDESALRRYLNGAGLNWWRADSMFGIRPDEYGKHGFLDGFTEEFLNATNPVRITSAIYNLPTAAVVHYDRFFLPSLEQIHATPQAMPGIEGGSWDYWKELVSGVGGTFAQVSLSGQTSYLYDKYRRSAINAQTTSHGIRLRSANTSNRFSTWIINSNGSVSSGGTANMSYRVVPVCVIC